MKTSLFKDLAQPKTEPSAALSSAKSAELKAERPSTVRGPSKFEKELRKDATKPVEAKKHSPRKEAPAPAKKDRPSQPAAAKAKSQPAAEGRPAPTKEPAKKDVAGKTSQAKPGLTQESDAKAKTLGTSATSAGSGVKATANQADETAVAEAKRLISKLREIMGGAEEAKAQFPVLAFVAGQLQSIDPKQLPDLIANNPLIKEVMASEDVAGTLSQVRPLGEIFSLLGASQQDLGRIQASGIDLNTKMAPRDFLQSMGIDTRRATAELSLLKDNLQLDGVSKYMLRAAKLRAQQRPHVSAKPGQKLSTNHPAAAIPTGQGAMPGAVPATVAAPVNGAVQQTASRTSQSALPTHNFTGVGMPGEAVTGYETAFEQNQANNTGRIHEQGGADILSQRRPASMPSAHASTHVQRQAVPVGQAAAVPVTPQSMMVGTEGMQEAGVPFAGQMAAGTPTQTMSLQEQLIQNRIPQSVASIDADASLVKAPVAASSWQPPVAGGAMAAQASLTGGMRSVSERLEAMMTPTAPVGGEAATLVSGAPQIMEQFDSGAGFDQSGQEQSSAGEQAQTEMIRELGQNMHRISDTGRSSAFSDQLNTDVTASLANKIMERATLMIKDGGGAMKIDLGNAELGKLEVAIDVQNEKVDLKILAASDQVRDLISQELPKLKDALSQQDLKLEQVEVGVGNGSSWSEHSSQGHSQGHQFSGLKESWTPSGHQVQSVVNQYSQSLTPSYAAKRAAQHSGALQVYA